MAYFANLDENNIVTQVIFVDNLDAQDEAKGIAYCNSIIPGNWIQTSYNHNIRKQYAGIGFNYDENSDVFIAPRPFASWVLNNNFDWEAPTPRPTEGFWKWNEEELLWESIEDMKDMG
jgi:hypothetical protein